jgi:16S rRNA processing protein RimM
MSSGRRSRVKNENHTAGSPLEGEPLYLVVGRLRKPHGLSGELLFDVHTDFPERIVPGKKIYVGEEHQPETIASIRPHQRGLLLKLSGKDTFENVELLRNQWVYVRSDELPALPDGEYYFHELIGLDVYDEQGMLLGKFKEILETGANDVYLILTPDGKELLLPAIDEIVKQIRIRDRKMIVNPPEWY